VCVCVCVCVCVTERTSLTQPGFHKAIKDPVFKSNGSCQNKHEELLQDFWEYSAYYFPFQTLKDHSNGDYG